MHSEKAKEPYLVPLGVEEPQYSQCFVLVAIISRTLFGRICQVGTWATIGISIQNGDISKPEGARRKVFVSTLDSEHRSLYNGLSRLANVAERCDLCEKVLGVPTHTCVFVGTAESDVGFIVETRIDLFETVDDGPSDTGVTESYV
jgi:hypothetical protein